MFLHGSDRVGSFAYWPIYHYSHCLARMWTIKIVLFYIFRRYRVSVGRATYIYFPENNENVWWMSMWCLGLGEDEETWLEISQVLHNLSPLMLDHLKKKKKHLLNGCIVGWLVEPGYMAICDIWCHRWAIVISRSMWEFVCYDENVFFFRFSPGEVFVRFFSI